MRAVLLVSMLLHLALGYRGTALPARAGLLALRSFSTLLNTPVVIRGIQDVAESFDCFFFDQFGCIHNGIEPYDNSIAVLQQLKLLQKRIVIISNSANRRASSIERLDRMGFAGLYDDVITSGEMAYEYLKANHQHQKALLFGWKDKALVSDLSEINIKLALIEDADIVILAGTQNVYTSEEGEPHMRISESLYLKGELTQEVQKIFQVAMSRGLKVVVANQDYEAITKAGTVTYMPGLLKDYYADLCGGSHNIVAFGKPNRDIFQQALSGAAVPLTGSKMSQQRLLGRCIHVGDSLHHDVSGAAGAGISSLLITRYGVHKDRLHGHGAQGEDVDAQRLLLGVCELSDSLELPRPSYVITKW
jgi:HAD superfamily hydrolase (TIGR01459 family)